MADDMPKQPNPTRRDFPAFPFDPYPIQSEFMCFLYESLNKGGIAMLESPTGTGKTLSIICSALQWLVDRRNQHSRQNHECTSNKTESYENEPDWMRDFTVPLPVPEKKTPKPPISKPKIPDKKIPKILEKFGEEIGEEEERDFLLEDYESEDEGMDRSKRKVKKCSGCDSSSSSSEEDEELEQEELRPKIYFVSRTHSQLSQFVKEFKRTKFASEINVVCLGSRKNLCINPSENHFWT